MNKKKKFKPSVLVGERNGVKYFYENKFNTGFSSKRNVSLNEKW
jgi:hypothetical protein